MAEITDENYLVWNQGRAVLVGFNFMLRVEALYDMPLKAVRAFTRDLEFDYIQEGGLNDYVHMRRKGITKPFTFEFDRYVGINYIDPLPLGANLLLPLTLIVSRIAGQFIPTMSARTYTFTGCTVIKKVYGELDGNKSELLVETVTIAYRELIVIDVPWSEPLGEAMDDSYNGWQGGLTNDEEKKLRERCDKVSSEADQLKDKVDEFGTALQKIIDADKKVEDEEAKLEKGKKPAKETPEEKAAREARKPKIKAASQVHKEAKDAVEKAKDAAEHARSFTYETGLKDLTKKAEELLPDARDKTKAVPSDANAYIFGK